ncbi:hypothetical protein IQ219_06280 [Synechocystis sp. LEGE 06083]|uniref:hypothetical protein n=1 Tax=Synechocystis sp. LEGE 06083 TaxID=915336 RepID=UPI001882046F|nr:hypothetical protein [Synechocystis sp. LEGE 06083]MBE9194922.1 hypothetical protein [Synechocystis sp. LEGE 06083]
MANLSFVASIDWGQYPYHPPSRQSSQFLIKVTNQAIVNNGGTYPIKELIKQDQYKWDSYTRVWSKIVSSKDFNLYEPFKESTWISEANEIEITINDHYCPQPVAIFHVDEGNLVRLNFDQRISDINHELQRLKWSETQGKNYLEEQYQKRSRHQLSDQQLDEFLAYLKTLPQ